ncbi:MAG: hypothetical protein ACRDS0_11605 [Pseudonocardiaceae bacterium]
MPRRADTAVSGHVDQDLAYDTDTAVSVILTLRGGYRLRLVADEAGALRKAVSVVVPPCVETTANGAVDWTIRITTGAANGAGGVAVRPALEWPRAGPQLAVVDISGTVMMLTGCFRPGAASISIRVDSGQRETCLIVPGHDVLSRRWLAWTARVFFGTRLLRDGWVLLHASAVRMATSTEERALVVLAGQRGGKSTVAHRACVERGARLMADDLVLLRVGRDGVTVVGWPTRVCVPVELLDNAMLDVLPDGAMLSTVVAGRVRRRMVLSPPEHERLLGIGRAGPTRLGGLLAITASHGGAPTRAGVLHDDRMREVLLEALDVPAQRLMMLDLLGVAGLPATQLTAPSGVACHVGELVDALRAVPAAGLELADGTELPKFPLWNSLGQWLPLLRGGG